MLSEQIQARELQIRGMMRQENYDTVLMATYREQLNTLKYERECIRKYFTV